MAAKSKACSFRSQAVGEAKGRGNRPGHRAAAGLEILARGGDDDAAAARPLVDPAFANTATVADVAALEQAIEAIAWPSDLMRAFVVEPLAAQRPIVERREAEKAEADRRKREWREAMPGEIAEAMHTEPERWLDDLSVAADTDRSPIYGTLRDFKKGAWRYLPHLRNLIIGLEPLGDQWWTAAAGAIGASPATVTSALVDIRREAGTAKVRVDRDLWSVREAAETVLNAIARDRTVDTHGPGIGLALRALSVYCRNRDVNVTTAPPRRSPAAERRRGAL